jgi:hypothetical protein
MTIKNKNLLFISKLLTSFYIVNIFFVIEFEIE